MPKKILLADDSITIQKVIGLTFANEDFELTVVDNGDDAVAQAREVIPDLIIADVVMPGRDGYEVCYTTKKDPELQNTPVLLLTGTFETFDEAMADKVGADGVITKPFESQALIDKVNELIGNAEAAAASVSADSLDDSSAEVDAPEPFEDLESVDAIEPVEEPDASDLDKTMEEAAASVDTDETDFGDISMDESPAAETPPADETDFGGLEDDFSSLNDETKPDQSSASEVQETELEPEEADDLPEEAEDLEAMSESVPETESVGAESMDTVSAPSPAAAAPSPDTDDAGWNMDGLQDYMADSAPTDQSAGTPEPGTPGEELTEQPAEPDTMDEAQPEASFDSGDSAADLAPVEEPEQNETEVNEPDDLPEEVAEIGDDSEIEDLEEDDAEAVFEETSSSSDTDSEDLFEETEDDGFDLQAATGDEEEQESIGLPPADDEDDDDALAPVALDNENDEEVTALEEEDEPLSVEDNAPSPVSEEEDNLPTSLPEADDDTFGSLDEAPAPESHDAVEDLSEEAETEEPEPRINEVAEQEENETEVDDYPAPLPDSRPQTPAAAATVPDSLATDLQGLIDQQMARLPEALESQIRQALDNTSLYDALGDRVAGIIESKVEEMIRAKAPDLIEELLRDTFNGIAERVLNDTVARLRNN